MTWFKQSTAYQPMRTTVTTTAWGGWPTMNSRCYKCIHYTFVSGVPVCYCASRTVKRDIHGDICVSFKEVQR